MVIISNFFVPRGYLGITIFPFIFLKRKNLKENLTLLNHEKIHLIQQLELLIIPFYVWYGIEFLIHLLILKNWDNAYRNISFEKEAEKNEKDLNYLKSRSFWNFVEFI